MKKGLWTIAVCLIAGLCLTGCGSKEQESKTSYKNEDNLRIERFTSFDNGELIVRIKNENNYDIGVVDIKAEYFDNSGNSISEDSDVIYDFKKDATFVTSLSIPTDEEGNYYTSDKVKVTATIDKDYQKDLGEVTSYTDQIESNYQVTGNVVNLTLTKKMAEKVSQVQAVLMYIKDNQPIYAQRIFTDEIESAYTEELDVPVDENENPISYDSIEVVINNVTVYYEDPGSNSDNGDVIEGNPEDIG